MNPPISWNRLAEVNPIRACEFKLVSLVDQYVTSDNLLDMATIAVEIDNCVEIIARAQKHYSTLRSCEYTGLVCKEFTRAGYALMVGIRKQSTETRQFCYKIYRESNGRNIVTSLRV